MWKLVKFTLLLAVPFTALYWTLYFNLVATSPLELDEMDFDGDGSVSFREADYAGSYEKRTVKRDSRECVQYVALRDGKVLKTICN